MSFDIVKAREQSLVPIQMRFRELQSGMPNREYTVTHVFRIPTPEQREEYQRKLLKVKGKRIINMGTSQANFDLWLDIVDHVEEYDNLPKESWKVVFRDLPILRCHIDEAIERLLELLGAEEAELEKKLEPSLEA